MKKKGKSKRKKKEKRKIRKGKSGEKAWTEEEKTREANTIRVHEKNRSRRGEGKRGGDVEERSRSKVSMRKTGVEEDRRREGGC